jgi:hypothetical protein
MWPRMECKYMILSILLKPGKNCNPCTKSENETVRYSSATKIKIYLSLRYKISMIHFGSDVKVSSIYSGLCLNGKITSRTEHLSEEKQRLWALAQPKMAKY